MSIALAPAPTLAELQRRPSPHPSARLAAKGLLRRVLSIREIGLLTIIAAVCYIAVGFWVRYNLHFWINDALSRTSDAVFVTIGRDPHLGAIGFYWPPLPQLIQLPLVPLLAPSGLTIMAGPISTAICAALTIPVLARIGRTLELSRRLIFVVCAAFALNPVIVYYSANGMSEACFFLVGSITMLGFLRYIRERSTTSIIVFSFGLCGVAMTRLEGPFLAFALIVVATFQRRQIKQAMYDFFLIGLPPALLFVFWLTLQWVLLKDFLFFRHQTGGPAPKPGTAVWLPDTRKDPWSAVPWAAHWVFVLGPAVVALAAVVMILGWETKERSRQILLRGCIGILAGMGTLVAIQIDQIIKGTGFGNPRYFTMAAVFAPIGVLWVASTRRSVFGRVWNTTLVGLLVLGACLGSYSLTSGRVTHVEGECAFFQYGVAQIVPALGRPQTGQFACARPADGLDAWQHADTWLDRHLLSRDRILADNDSNFPAVLFTHHANQFVVRNDRDWDKIVANPVGTITYIMTEASTRSGLTLQPGSTDAGAAAIAADPTEWTLAASFSGAVNLARNQSWVQIWRYTAAAPGA